MKAREIKKIAEAVADKIIEDGLEFGGRFEDVELVLELASKLGLIEKKSKEKP